MVGFPSLVATSRCVSPLFPPPVFKVCALSASMHLSGLSFTPGVRIQGEVWSKFGLPISWPDLVSSSFALVVVFGRCKFRLSTESVAILLQATIGGAASHFKVSHLQDWTFKFFVSSKWVGFFVPNLRSFTCDAY